MAGFLLDLNATANCPHGGRVSILPANARVLVAGQPIATLADTGLVAGCPFTVPGPKPQPCVKVQWTGPAVRVLVNGQPALLQTSTGLCQSVEQIPQGSPIVATTQVRASAS